MLEKRKEGLGRKGLILQWSGGQWGVLQPKLLSEQLQLGQEQLEEVCLGGRVGGRKAGVRQMGGQGDGWREQGCGSWEGRGVAGRAGVWQLGRQGGGWEGRGVAAGAAVPTLCSQQEFEPHGFMVPWGCR